MLAALLLNENAFAATVTEKASTEVSAERSGVRFSGRASLGYLTGEAHEYVYWADMGGHKASELIWDIDSLYMMGLGGSVQPLKWLRFNADLWFNVGDGDGQMVDYDWMIPGLDWTHRSISPNTDVTTGLVFDLNAELTAFSTPQVAVTGIIGYRHDKFEWQARGGSYIYSSYFLHDTIGSFPDDVLCITYEQTFDVPYLGLGFSGKFDKFHATARLIYSAWVSGEAVDQHHMRNLVTYDDFSGESMWGLDVGVGYNFTNNLAVKLAYAYEKYDSMKGDSEWHESGTIFTLSEGAGAELETSTFMLTLTYSF